MPTKIDKYEYEIEKTKLKIDINNYKITQALGTWHDKEERMKHNTNLKKLQALEKQETEEWKKKWLR